MIVKVNYTISGIYNQTLTNVSGCDSVVTLDLGIITVDTSLSYAISSSTLTALGKNATYQWLDCNNNNSPIVGETNQSYNASVNGDYAVEVTKSNCTDISPCESVNNVGINSNNEINYLLYPNPNNGSFIMERSSANEQVEIIIYDLSGKSVFSDSWKSGRKKNIECNLSSGYYYMHISNANKIQAVKKIIIN